MADAMILDVDGVGQVELSGKGPWYVHEHTRFSFDIRDSEGRDVNPAVTAVGPGGRGLKRNQGVVWANKSIPNAIVTKFNAELAKQSATDGVSGD